jgi:Holliday junction resolvase-like predicted endonuclease
MGIAKYLKAGKICINTSEKQIEIADRQIILPYNKLNDSDWGYVYEKFVGQKLESEGYEVIYNGLEKGWLDRGIDLIAIKNNQLNFVQCKYSCGNISKSKIEWILYKASRVLFENYAKYNKKIHFTLIVSKKEECFSKRKPKNFRLNFTDNSKVEYPMLQYFLDHNFVQDKVKLEFREIEMNK